MKKTAITLLSGGLDSSVATLLAMKKCKIKLALTFDYGQRSIKQEIIAAQKFCKKYKIKHKIITLPWLSQISKSSLVIKNKKLSIFRKLKELDNKKIIAKSSANAWVSNRNAVFINIAASFAETYKYDFIITGFNHEEAKTFSDNSADFIKTTNKMLTYSTRTHPKVISPTEKLDKFKIVIKAIDLKLNPDFFWSCYKGNAKMCGSCESCTRTIRAYKKNNKWEIIKNKFSQKPKAQS